MHQGWPKLAQSLWMATRGGGLAATVFAPSEVHALVRGAGLQPGHDTTPIRIVETTDYPFRSEVTFELHPDRPVRFPFSIRIPAWVAGATVSRNGSAPIEVPAGRFHDIDVTWKPGDRVVLRLPMAPRLSTWHRASVAVERRPARLFAPDAGGLDWKPATTGMKRPAPPPAKDWEVRPRSPWNYGLVVGNPGARQADPALKVTEKAVGEYPFSPLGAPVEIAAAARRVPEWTLVDGSAGLLPQSPVMSSAPDETITLVPYGSAKLRVTLFRGSGDRSGWWLEAGGRLAGGTSSLQPPVSSL
jgi:uncharacterized protein